MKNASFWLRSSDELSELKQNVEQALTGFSYYPEIEWSTYGFRPPEGLPFHGAWRSLSRREFVYLVGEPAAPTQVQADRLILILGAAGEDRLALLWSRFEQLLSRFRRLEELGIHQQKMRARRKGFEEAYTGTRITIIFSVFTAAVNAISFALRTLPILDANAPLASVYGYLVMAVNVLALSSLLMLGAFCLLYVGKHLLFMVRL